MDLMRKKRKKMHIDHLWSRGKEFLGTDYAIMGGAMSWVSEANLVASISNAGGFGVIACSAMPPDALRKQIQHTRQLTQKPFGVNIIIMHPQLQALLAVCKEEEVSHVVLAGGLPNTATIHAIKEYGCKVMCFAPARIVAKKLLRAKVDALIVEGMEAGGHVGPVSTSVLAQEILPEMGEQAVVFIAGGIGRGEVVASYLKMGASGCQLGTKFACAKESIAHPNFKRALIKASARNATISVQLDPEFPVIPVRAIENRATDAFMQKQTEMIQLFRANKISKTDAQLAIEHFWAGALKKAVIDGDVENGSLMAGQSVGMVTEEASVADIIRELVEQAQQYLDGAE